MRLAIELCGGLREAGLGDSVELVAPEGATAREVLALLGGMLGPAAGLLSGAALATETEVLPGAERVPAGRRLAVLPPVSGG